MKTLAVAKKQSFARSQSRRVELRGLFSEARQRNFTAVREALGHATVQKKVQVGPSDDAFEKEADATAEKVMQDQLHSPIPDSRKDEEKKIQKKESQGLDYPDTEPQPWPEPQEGEPENLQASQGVQNAQGAPSVQRKASTQGGPAELSDSDLTNRIYHPMGGRPLSQDLLRFFESRFKHDFSDVRIHDDSKDQQDAQALQSRAFTYGNHIWIGKGESAHDKRLMAHELTHVIQQGASRQYRVQRSFKELVSGLAGDVKSAVGSVKSLAGDMKDKLLGQFKEWATQIPGYSLLGVILSRDPITDMPVERTAPKLARGLLELVPGGSEIFSNLQKSNTIEKAGAWLTEQIKGLDLTWEKIKSLFRKAWEELSIRDILDPMGALRKLKEIFSAPIERIRKFAAATINKILEFIFEGAMTLFGPLGKKVMELIRKAGAVFSKIIQDPVGFLKNLLNAVKLGFQKFLKNIWEHLKTGLATWILGTLEDAGITLPEKLDLKGFLSVGLQILNLTYATFRKQLVRVLGERRVAFIEKSIDVVKTLVTDGLMGLWNILSQWIGKAKDMAFGMIRNWAVTKIVEKAVLHLATMFNPVGAIIESIRVTYDTLSFFLENMKKIAAVVSSIFDSIGAIVEGKIEAAADFIERTMARTIPLMIGFLADLVGLGGLSLKIRDFITQVRAEVEKVLTKLVNFIVEKAAALFSGIKKLGSTIVSKIKGLFSEKFKMSGVEHELYSDEVAGQAVIMMCSNGAKNLKTILEAIVDGLQEDKKVKIKEFIKEIEAICKALDKLKEKNEQSRTARDSQEQGSIGRSLHYLRIRIEKYAADNHLTDFQLTKLLPKISLHEGEVNTFSSLNSLNDDKEVLLTGDHQPQTAVMEVLPELLPQLYVQDKDRGKLPVFPEPEGIGEVAKYNKDAGICINISSTMHEFTRTFRKPKTKKETVDKLKEETQRGTIKDNSNSVREVIVMKDKDFDNKENAQKKAREKIQTIMASTLDDDSTTLRKIYEQDRWYYSPGATEGQVQAPNQSQTQESAQNQVQESTQAQKSKRIEKIEKGIKDLKTMNKNKWKKVFPPDEG